MMRPHLLRKSTGFPTGACRRCALMPLASGWSEMMRFVAQAIVDPPAKHHLNKRGTSLLITSKEMVDQKPEKASAVSEAPRTGAMM